MTMKIDHDSAGWHVTGAPTTENVGPFPTRKAARARFVELKGGDTASTPTEAPPASPDTNDGAEEAPTMKTITLSLSGKVHTILLTGNSEVGGKPGALDLPAKVTGWQAKQVNAPLVTALTDAERVNRSKGYVAKVTLTQPLARRLVKVLGDHEEALANLKGGGYDANNCRRYAAEAIDRLNDLAEAEGWRLIPEEAAA